MGQRVLQGGDRDQLRSAWIRQLKDDWRTANYSFFKDRMLLPGIEIMGAKTLLGRWEGGKKRELAVSESLILEHPWGCVQEVLYHEMAHQYAEEALGIQDDEPHGEVFRRICREHGLDPSATGDIKTWTEGRARGFRFSSPGHRILSKVHKLLALAKSANRHEAEMAMERAHQLLCKHNVSLLDAQTKRRYVHRQVGEVGRKNPAKSLIGTILCRFFFVEAIWVFGYDQHRDRKGRVLEIYGTPENVEMAEYIHDYLHGVSNLLWRDYKDSEKLAGDKHRRTFIHGLLDGFFSKLDAGTPLNRSRGLVWKGDPELNNFFSRRNPKVRHTAFRYSHSSREAYESGVKRGFTLVVHKGVHEKRQGRGRLLE